MMKQTCTAALGLFLAAAGLAAADDVRGVVRKVDPDKKEVVLEVKSKPDKGTSLTFSVGPDVKITLGKQPGKLADLEPGLRVHFSYETRDGKQILVSLTSRAGKKPAAGA